MKTWVVVVASIALGLCLGLGITFAHVNLFPAKEIQTIKAPETLGDPRMPPLQPKGSPQPIAVFDSYKYNFGAMEFDTKKSYEFTVRNEGEAPLILKQGDTSCKCTVGSLDNGEVQPGEETKIKLEWTAIAKFEDFRQTATIYTNDPNLQRVVLAIEGRIKASVHTHPPRLSFGTVLAHEAQTTEVRVYSSHDEVLHPTGMHLDPPELEPYFEFKTEPLPRVEAEVLGGRSGFVITGTLKPGLPLGPLGAVLEVDVNIPDVEHVKVGVEATIAADLSIVGPGWRGKMADRGLLVIGPVSEHQVHEKHLKIMVRGPQRDQSEIKVTSVKPPQLQVNIGEARSINQGLVTEIPLTITIPEDCPQMTYRGAPGEYGEIVLETNHPQVPTLKMLVDFSVRPPLNE